MSSDDPVHAGPGAASTPMSSSDESKPFWPSDLLNLNDAEMSKLFEPEQQNTGFDSYYQGIVSSSSSVSLPTESLESLIQDLDELSQPDYVLRAGVSIGPIEEYTSECPPVISHIPDSTESLKDSACVQPFGDPSVNNVREFVCSLESSAAVTSTRLENLSDVEPDTFKHSGESSPSKALLEQGLPSIDSSFVRGTFELDRSPEVSNLSFHGRMIEEDGASTLCSSMNENADTTVRTATSEETHLCNYNVDSDPNKLNLDAGDIKHFQGNDFPDCIKDEAVACLSSLLDVVVAEPKMKEELVQESPMNSMETETCDIEENGDNLPDMQVVDFGTKSELSKENFLNCEEMEVSQGSLNWDNFSEKQEVGSEGMIVENPPYCAKMEECDGSLNRHGLSEKHEADSAIKPEMFEENPQTEIEMSEENQFKDGLPEKQEVGCEMKLIVEIPLVGVTMDACEENLKLDDVSDKLGDNSAMKLDMIGENCLNVLKMEVFDKEMKGVDLPLGTDEILPQPLSQCSVTSKVVEGANNEITISHDDKISNRIDFKTECSEEVEVNTSDVLVGPTSGKEENPLKIGNLTDKLPESKDMVESTFLRSLHFYETITSGEAEKSRLPANGKHREDSVASGKVTPINNNVLNECVKTDLLVNVSINDEDAASKEADVDSFVSKVLACKDLPITDYVETLTCVPVYHEKVHLNVLQKVVEVIEKVLLEVVTLSNSSQILHSSELPVSLKMEVLECPLEPLSQLKSEFMEDVENSSLQSMNEIQSQHLCTVCGSKFVKLTNFSRHMASHSEEQVFCCDPCDLVFVSDSNLLSHNVQLHDHQKEFKCKLCKVTTATSPEFEEHMGVHLDQKPFICSECNSKFKKFSEFCLHVNLHTGEVIFKCSSCSLMFRSERDCKNHTIMVHSVHSQNDQSVTQKILEKADSKFVCEICGKDFTKARSLQSHLAAAHRTKAALKRQKKNFPLECTDCRKQFQTFSCYSRHISTHKNRSRRSSLDAKCKIKASSLSFKEMKFSCDICSAPFDRAIDLKRHTLSQHACNEASKRRSTRRSTTSSPKVLSVSMKKGNEIDKCLAKTEEFKKNYEGDTAANMESEVDTAVHTNNIEDVKVKESYLNQNLKNSSDAISLPGESNENVPSVSFCSACSKYFGSHADLLQHKQLHPFPF